MTKLLRTIVGLAVLAAPLYGQVVAITNARILTVSRGVIENGTIIVRDGKIAEVGVGIKVPAGSQLVEARGQTVIPGIIDAGSQLGLVEIPSIRVTDDSTEYTGPIHPELQVIDAVNARSENILVARPAGITNAVVTPAGGNLIAGRGAMIQLNGASLDEVTVKSPAALYINLGEASKQTYGNKDGAPGTRMGAIAMVRQAFLKAQAYQAERVAKGGSATAEEQRDLKMEALASALAGEMPVVIRASRVGDIESALRIAEEFHLKIILAEANSAWRLADRLAAKKIPVIVGPIFQAPSRIEAVDTRLDNAALLQKAGVTVAIQTGSANLVRDLWFAVGYAIANGLPEEAALAAVTINPARMFSVDARLGSIEVGKDANLVLLDGAPFRTKTHVLKVMIRGSFVDLSNHQTKIYEMYKKKYGIN